MEGAISFKNCRQYKYLGIKIVKDGSMEQNIRDSNIQGRKAAAMLNLSLWER